MNNTIYLTSFVTLCCFNSTRSLTHILIIEGYNERIHCKNRFLRQQQVITEVAYLSLKTASVCIVFQVDLVSSNEVPWEGVKVQEAQRNGSCLPFEGKGFASNRSLKQFSFLRRQFSQALCYKKCSAVRRCKSLGGRKKNGLPLEQKYFATYTKFNINLFLPFEK